MTPIRQVEIRAARVRMMMGANLQKAADHIGVEPQELDLALWRYLGRHGQPEDPNARRAYFARVA